LFSYSVLGMWKGSAMFTQDRENCLAFYHAPHAHTHTHTHTHTHIHTQTQNPNVADVTIELFAKSGMQWQTNSRGFHWNTNVPWPTAIHYS